MPLSAVLKSSFKTKQLSLLLFFAGLLLDALAPNFAILLLGRAIQGLGTGIALPLMFDIILEQVAADKIGLMMGFWQLDHWRCSCLGADLRGPCHQQPGLALRLLFLDAFDHLVSLLRPLRHPAEVQDRQDQAGILCARQCLLKYHSAICRRHWDFSDFSYCGPEPSPIWIKGPAADSNRHPARLYFPGRNRSLPVAHVLQERENRRWI